MTNKTRTWVSSDLHFGHQNIMKFCPETRPYSSVDEMNKAMIAEWNNSVADGDLVYLVGDVAFLPSAEAVKILKQLKGDKVLIEGNHDKKLVKDPVFRRCFQDIYQYHEFRYNKISVIMFHYPIAEWNTMHHGAVHLHGHTHGSVTGLEEYRCRDVGMDATGKVVSLLDDVIADALTGKIKGHY